MGPFVSVSLCFRHRYTRTYTHTTDRKASYVHNRSSVVVVSLVVGACDASHAYTRTEKSHAPEQPSPYEASENNTLFMIRA